MQGYQDEGGELVQLIALLPERSLMVARVFLEFSLGNYVSCTSEHPIPQYEDVPEIICTSDKCLLSELERRDTEEYQAYWKTTIDSRIKMAGLFYSDDGAMIGVIITPEELCTNLFEALAKNHNVQYGYIGGDEIPPLNRHEIINFSIDSRSSKIVRGVVHSR